MDEETVAEGGEFGLKDVTTFGSSCAGNPPPEPVTITASYDGDLGAPKCSIVGNACTSGGLLNSRGTITGASEPNRPNTLDGCVDRSSGVYHQDESIDMVTVKAADDTGILRAGGEAFVEAKVWAWDNGASDRADFYYNSNSVTNPVWEEIAVNVASGGGQERTITSPVFVLPSNTLIQSVRVNYRYSGNASPCSGGAYDDADDLVFKVAEQLPGEIRAPGPIQGRLPKSSPVDSCESIDKKDKEKCAAASSCEWRNGQNKGCYTATP